MSVELLLIKTKLSPMSLSLKAFLTMIIGSATLTRVADTKCIKVLILSKKKITKDLTCCTWTLTRSKGHSYHNVGKRNNTTRLQYKDESKITNSRS